MWSRPVKLSNPKQYRVLDYAAYYRYVKSRLQAVVDAMAARLKRIRNRSRTVRSADGGRNATASGERMIICRLSRDQQVAA